MINYNSFRVQQKSSGTNINMSNTSFPNNQNNQQATASGMQQQKINDDKQTPQMNPLNTNQQQSMHSQNNNNHGSGISQQLTNMSGRNMNAGHTQMNKTMHQMTSQQQATFQQQQQDIFKSLSHLMTQKDPQKASILQQMASPFSYQQHQNMAQSHSTAQSSVNPDSQKLQGALISQQMNQNKQMYQSQPNQMKSSSMNYGGTSLTQFSPTKPIHPQMKTTAKIASPGSQLQNLQKSPPTQQPKNVPSTTSNSSSAPATSNLSTTSSFPTSPSNMIAQTTSTANKSQTSNSPNKPAIPTDATHSASPNVSSPVPANNPVNTVSSNTVPLTTLASTNAAAIPSHVNPTNTKPQSGPNDSLTTVNNTSKDAAPKKTVEQNTSNNKEQASTATQSNSKSVSTQNEPIKQNDDKKPAVQSESGNKLEKDVQEKQGNQAVLPSKSSASNVIPPNKSITMRLATTPPRKKPPPTIPKKVTTPQKLSTKVAVTPVKTDSSKVVEKSPETTITSKVVVKMPAANSSAGSASTPKTKRVRTKVQPYQSPTYELQLVTKLSTQTANPTKNGDDKLTIFYKNEFLAVRNGEGGFYLCQTMHNVYKSSPKIKIRWLNEKEEGKIHENGSRIYNLDFYDQTDFECVLTTVELEKVDSKTYELPKEELARVENILKKAIDVEKGIAPRPAVTEENPDGLDLSLYKDESQLDKISSKKRKSSKKSSDDEDSSDEPLKKKPATKLLITPKKTNTPRASTKKPFVDEESSESDEENLMEIKKKSKNQSPAKQEKVNEKPETSKAALDTSTKGRKRMADKPLAAIKSPKMLKTETSPVKQAVTKAKGVPKKNDVPEKKGNVDEKKTEAPEKKKTDEVDKSVKIIKVAAEKKQPAKKLEKASDSVINAKSTQDSPSKKVTGKEASTEPQSKASSARARNTRSKK